MSLTIPFSAACERNKDVILTVLKSHFESSDQHKTVLEIGSGTAQHAVHFAQNLPGFIWQTSDQECYLEGIQAQLENAQMGNVLPPICLDVTADDWNNHGQHFDAIYSANTLHIMSWDVVQAFFAGLPRVIDKGLLIIYGPFKYAGQFTSASNQAFDQTLRSRKVGSAIRDFEKVNALAEEQGFSLVDDVMMPANNQILIWRKN